MPGAERYGASPEEWLHFDMLLGLTEDLLPVVSNPSARISPQSSMKGLGKTPSLYNGQRSVAGFVQWTSHHTTAEEIDRWSKEPDYGICIQTRNVRALDLDITDGTLAGRIRDRCLARGSFPARIRQNASKCLLAFRLRGEFVKRKFAAAHGIVEFLASGQQFVAVGTHPSGARYEWEGGLPEEFPELTAEEFEALWSALVAEFAVETPNAATPSTKQQTLASVFEADARAKWLLDRGQVKKVERDGRIHITCPWEEEHTTDSGESATTYFPAHTGGYVNGHYQCLHAHCEHRSDAEFDEALGYVAEELLSDFTALGDAQPTAQEKPAERLKFQAVQAADFAVHAPARWLIKHVLPHAELGVKFGDSGSGKSFMALDMGMAVACGVPWRGHKTVKGRVVYVAAEGAGGFRRRLHAFAHHHQVDLRQIAFHVLPASPNLLDKADALEVAKAILAAGGADLVVVDTFAQTTAGGNENSGEDVGKALAHCKGIHRATGALVLLIHHSGKDASKGARGWSGLRAAADVELEVARVESERSLTVTKQKDGEDGQEFGFRLQVVPLGLDEDGEAITSCVIEHTDQVVKATPKEALKGLGKNERIVFMALGEMIAPGVEKVELEALVSAAINRLPRGDSKEDRRRDVVSRSINSLAERGRLKFVDGGYVKL